MPTPGRSGRHQLALYWERVGDNDQGEPTFATRIELDVRWVDKRQMVTDANGAPVATEASVKVDREIIIGSVLWKGGEDDIPGAGTGDPDSDFFQVVTYDETPNTKGNNPEREITLNRFRDGDLEYAS